MDLEGLRHRFGGPNVSFRRGPGELTAVDVEHEFGSVSVAFNGAHVLDYKTSRGDSVLWLSPHSNFVPGKPIRGGIPICWPWFGPHSTDPGLPAHGFARLSQWTLSRIGSPENEEGIEGVFELSSSDQFKSHWPHPFHLTYAVSILDGSLDISLVARNLGEQPVTLSGALHTYLGVNRIDQVEIRGLEGCDYLDQLEQLARKRQIGVVVFDREVDRIYLEGPERVQVTGTSAGIPMELLSRGSRSTVVWNPWIDKARRMPDFGDEDYLQMVCVETANAGPDQRRLRPKATHELGVRIRPVMD